MCIWKKTEDVLSPHFGFWAPWPFVLYEMSPPDILVFPLHWSLKHRVWHFCNEMQVCIKSGLHYLGFLLSKFILQGWVIHTCASETAPHSRSRLPTKYKYQYKTFAFNERWYRFPLHFPMSFSTWFLSWVKVSREVPSDTSLGQKIVEYKIDCEIEMEELLSIPVSIFYLLCRYYIGTLECGLGNAKCQCEPWLSWMVSPGVSV